ncbi:MAG TPA: GNAT family N-acetyltransferase [Tepidisphaeraceae bacterium]|nr:GNAT family N-acetyltransferase [Tepidisphaeraceae bacterium]
MVIAIERITEPTAEVRLLITELEAELAAVYSAEQRHGLNLASIFRPEVSFFIARREHEPVGCGGIAFIDGIAELKRMYVRPDARGRGVARAILARLEQEARDRSVQRLVLETGDAQHAAIRLYERAGFGRCAPFGPYAQMPPSAIRRSVFLEKPIAQTGDG